MAGGIATRQLPKSSFISPLGRVKGGPARNSDFLKGVGFEKEPERITLSNPLRFAKQCYIYDLVREITLLQQVGRLQPVF